MVTGQGLQRMKLTPQRAGGRCPFKRRPFGELDAIAPNYPARAR
jgi:hypothetical protein